MSINWDAAVSGEKTEANSNYVPISCNSGSFNAHYIGTTEPWFEPCRDCNGTGTRMDGITCKCDNGRKAKIGLKYELESGTVEQESMTFKLSEPQRFTNKAGQHVVLSPSTLYKRFCTLADMPGAKPHMLAGWAQANPEPRIPCTIVIEPNATGKYMKITTVILRGGVYKKPIEKIVSKARANAQVAANRDEELESLEDLFDGDGL